MDSFTVAPELEGTKGDIIAARIEVPILVVMIYGIVEFIRLGWSQDYYLYTYAPVLGGVAASVGLFTYFFLVSVERKKSRKNLLVLLGFLPYFYSLYIMGFLGLYTIYEGIIGKFSFWSMIGACPDVGQQLPKSPSKAQHPDVMIVTHRSMLFGSISVAGVTSSAH